MPDSPTCTRTLWIPVPETLAGWPDPCYCLLISGKNALTKEKARGGPKARGQIHGIKSMTEGLIALAAIFVSGRNTFDFENLIKPSPKARYLLTPDPELQSVGSETKIPYEADYDFYLQCLLKQSMWAIRTIHFFNMEVFGDKMGKILSAGPWDSGPEA